MWQSCLFDTNAGTERHETESCLRQEAMDDYPLKNIMKISRQLGCVGSNEHSRYNSSYFSNGGTLLNFQRNYRNNWFNYIKKRPLQNGIKTKPCPEHLSA